MIHSTPDSMKFKRLMRKLDEPRRGTAGLLELLWITTQKNTPQGDIGKFSNEEIAIECDWLGDADLLVKALLDCGWLEESNEYRLVVHDWHEHAPGWVKRQLKRHKKSFVTASGLLTVTDDVLEATPNLTKPKETKPNPTQPNLDLSGGRSPSEFFGECSWLDDDGSVIHRDIVRFRELSGMGKNRIDSFLAGSLCILSRWQGNEMMRPIASAIRQDSINNPKRYLQAAIRRQCEEQKVDLEIFNQMVAVLFGRWRSGSEEK